MLNHAAPDILTWVSFACQVIMLWQLGPVWDSLLAQPQLAKRPRQPAVAAIEVAACPACEAPQSQTDRALRPGDRPARLEIKRGRPRQVDTSRHYCPHQGCRYYGWVGLGNIRANGHPNGGRFRQLECIVCGQTFMETINTIFYGKGKGVPAETIWQALKALAEGLDIRATSRVFGVDPNTVQSWLHQAAVHLEAVTAYLLHDLHLSQVQVDELWALLGHSDPETSGQVKRRAKRWVWAAIDPVSKLMIAWVVGDRSLACAQGLIHLIAQRLAAGCLPLFLSDQWAAYQTALLTHFGHWVQPPRQPGPGRPAKPRWQPLPGLLYAQVVKHRRKGRVVRVTHRVVYGSLAHIQATLQASGVGQVINTAFIERLNLTLRQHLAALGRRVSSLAKTEPGLRQQLSLGQAYYNFCLPHTALRLPLPQPQPTKGTGSLKMWQPRTPAMAAGLTSQPWPLEAVLLWRIPPWPQPAALARQPPG